MILCSCCGSDGDSAIQMRTAANANEGGCDETVGDTFLSGLEALQGRRRQISGRRELMGLLVLPKGFDGDTAAKTHAATNAGKDESSRTAGDVLFGGLRVWYWDGRSDLRRKSWLMGLRRQKLFENEWGRGRIDFCALFWRRIAHLVQILRGVP